MEILSHSEAETEAAGERLGASLSPGTVLAYRGGLGMGKTAFTRGLARGLGVEETARQMRYEFLRGAADAMGCGRIATAHSADDNLETLLLHLVRGAGLHGLAGIPPRRGVVVRPAHHLPGGDCGLPGG